MANGRTASVLRQLRVLFASGTTTGLSDGELLERFTARRDESAAAALVSETAFAALMDRHGAMVWGVCRRVLGGTHEAEDAFQATFLVLVRKAGSVRVDESLGRWLYGVAHRVALRARSQARRREASPGPATPARSSEDPAVVVELDEVSHALGEEVDRLPAKYRCPIELCYLQGLTYDQAARQLNWPVATVKGRLVRGRLKLRKRLARRGLSPVAVAGFREARLAVPPKLVHSTVRAVTSNAQGLFPAAVTALTEGVLKMMMWEKLKLAAAGALVAVGLTAGALAQQQEKPQGPKDRGPEAPQSKAKAQPLENPNGRPADDRRWIKTLTSGATIEVVGVSPHPSGPDTWWRPDGTPLSEPPSDPFGTRLTSDQDVVPRAIVVRLTGIPAEADHKWWINRANGGSQGVAKRDGKPVPGLSEAVTFFPSSLDMSTIRFEVAAGPWKTVQTWGRARELSVPERRATSLAPVATKKGTTLSVTHNIQELSVRLVAMDGNGKEHPAQERSGSGVGNYYQIMGEFDLPPDQIEEFRVQTRPYEKVEIDGVALKPSGPA